VILGIKNLIGSQQNFNVECEKEEDCIKYDTKKTEKAREHLDGLPINYYGEF
jgi:hypothetical protein